MKAGYVDRNFFKAAMVKLLGKLWPGVIFSSLSPFNVADVNAPTIQYDTECIVKHIYSGICGSDISLLHAKVDPRVAPAALSRYSRIYLGHEILAEIRETGSDVESLEVGDRVTVIHGQSCNLLGMEECTSCQLGQPYLCKNASQKSAQHLHTGGGWAAHWKYDYRQLIKIPDDISNEFAVLTEPMGIAVHAVLRKVPEPSDKVLIYGAGFIGIATLLACRFLAPEAEIYVIARYDFQARLVKKYGGIPLKSQSYRDMTDVTGAYYYKGILSNEMLLGGFDIIFDCVGTGDTIHNSMRWSRARGTVVIVGVNLYLSKIDLTPIWYQEVDLIGSYGSGREVWQGEETTTEELVFELFRSGLFDPKDVITHKFRLMNYKDAIKVLQQKSKHDALKVVFDFTQE